MSNRNIHPCPIEPNTYQTGNTCPPKSHSVIIAFLLILVIVLCGIVTVLSLTNIRLFQQLTAQQDSQVLPISFYSSQETGPVLETAPDSDRLREYVQIMAPTGTFPPGKAFLGLEGEEVSGFYQLYYRLPEGFYVNRVIQDSAAYKAGLQKGDIILSLDGTRICGPEDLSILLSSYFPGDVVTLRIYRSGRQYQATFPLDEAT